MLRKFQDCRDKRNNFLEFIIVAENLRILNNFYYYFKIFLVLRNLHILYE